MSKRSNGEGSIFKRTDGRWCALYFVMDDGKEKRKYVYGKTQKEAKEKMKKAQIEASKPKVKVEVSPRSR